MSADGCYIARLIPLFIPFEDVPNMLAITSPHPVRLAALVLAILAALQPCSAQVATAIYTGGDILTMRGNAPEYVDCLAVKDGTILFVGPTEDAQKYV